MHKHEFRSRPPGAIHCFICGLPTSHDCHDPGGIFKPPIGGKLRGQTFDATALEDNTAPYLTIMKGVGVYLVALMEWSPTQDCYTIAKISEPSKHKGDAILRCADWARKDGLEIR